MSKNHSCDPNTWFVSDIKMTARRDIQPNEEITYDYATSETAFPVIFDPCLCKSQNCRGKVLGSDYK